MTDQRADIEAVCRALCEADDRDPDQLEPGDDPYMNNTPCIDGYNRKDEPCHFFWRRYDERARAAIEALRPFHAAAEAKARREAYEDGAGVENTLAEALARIAYEGPDDPAAIAHDALKATARPILQRGEKP